MDPALKQNSEIPGLAAGWPFCSCPASLRLMVGRRMWVAEGVAARTIVCQMKRSVNMVNNLSVRY